MDGEESESMILDPTEQGTTLINVFNNDPNAHIAIKNVGDKRWDGTFRFVASLYNQSTQQYTPFQQRSGSGWGTPGYTWNYERLFSNLEDGKYRMEIYANDTLIDNSWHFVIKDGVAAWLTVNKQRYIPIVNNTIIVHENITAVDLRNRSGLEIIPNNNPNTTYLISSNNSNVLPDEVNTIYCSYYGNTCPNMHLNDGYPYYSPIDFNVENISFRMAINAPGYNTLCIPFTANECKIKRNGIWQDISLRNNCISFLSFSDMINTTVLFDYLLSDSITAWSPYLISMTDNIEELELSGQNLRIQSTPNAMPRTDRYRFQCNMTSGNSYDIYAIVEGSNRFDYQIAPQLLPFRSYFYPLYDFYRDESLIIEINPIPYLVGDVNGSGTVTVTDVVVTSQYVLEMNPQPFVFEAADVNNDGNITVTDVSRISWMVLNPTLNAPLRAPALWNNGDRMSAEGITLMPGETCNVSILLDNEMAYSAFQLDLTLPEGLTASNFQLTDRSGNHAFDVNTLANGKTRALCYSPMLTAIRGNEGTVLTFDVTANDIVNGYINVDGIELVTADCQTVRLDAFAIAVNNATTVNEQLAGKSIAKVEYFNLAGQQIDRPASGVTLVVTTYTDGTHITTKVIK